MQTSPATPTTLAQHGAAWILSVGTALDGNELAGELTRALDVVERNLGVGLLVCAAGADGIFANDTPSTAPAWSGALAAVLPRLARTPSIAVIQGRTSGVSAGIALACRALAMAPNATLAWPDATLGLVPAGGACWRLPRRMGLVAALPHLVGAPITRDHAVETRLALALSGGPEELLRAAALALPALPARPPRPRQALGLTIAQSLRPFRGTIFRAAERHLPPALRESPAAKATLRCAAIGWEQGPAAADAYALATNETLGRDANARRSAPTSP